MFTKVIMKILHNLHQQILFLLIKRIKQSLDHTFMKFSVMTVCFPPLLRKRYKRIEDPDQKFCSPF